jgi:hypothetical protein
MSIKSSEIVRMFVGIMRKDLGRRISRLHPQGPDQSIQLNSHSTRVLTR